MYGQQLLGERPILLDQGWQLTDEEQVHVIAMGARLQKPQNRLRQEERVEGVFTCHRRDSHCLGHVAGPVRILGEVTPDQTDHCQDPDGQTDRSMKLQKNRVGRPGRGEIDEKGEYEDEQHEAGGQPVHQSRGPIKNP